MKHYLLISDTKEYKINNFILDSISKYIETNTGKKLPFKELSSNKAYEWELSDIDLNKKLKNLIEVFLFKKKIDCNFINPITDRKKKLLLADMDSTIIREESLNELANLIGKGKEVAQITEEAMSGKIDFEEALIKRVAILRGEPTDILNDLKNHIHINIGAKELIKTMGFYGSKTVLVSGGFTFLTEYLKNLLGFNHAHANSLEISNIEDNQSTLSGKVKIPILDKKAKLKYLEIYINKYNLTFADTICVGDGANDIEMIEKACLGVSFNGKPILDRKANIRFKNTNLKGLLYAQGYTEKEIIS